jgi:hypothetical protein
MKTSVAVFTAATFLFKIADFAVKTGGRYAEEAFLIGNLAGSNYLFFLLQPVWEGL